MLVVSWDDNGEGSAPGGRSLSMPLSLDMTEKRVMSDGDGSLGDSPSSKSSCSWLRGNCSDVELDRNHLDSPRPVKVFNIHHQHVTLSAIHTHTRTYLAWGHTHHQSCQRWWKGHCVYRALMWGWRGTNIQSPQCFATSYTTTDIWFVLCAVLWRSHSMHLNSFSRRDPKHNVIYGEELVFLDADMFNRLSFILEWRLKKKIGQSVIHLYFKIQ